MAALARLDRPLAWLGLMANAIALPLLIAGMLAEAPFPTVRLVVGLAAVLPVLVLGLVAAAALVAGRRWGRVLAIVALSLSLAVALSAGIVWLVLVPLGRAAGATGLGVLWLAQLLLLIHWSLPRRR